MEGSSASQAQAIFKATLLGMAILSMITWVPHMYSCIKIFLVSLPSAAFTLATPKCLFVFSNIIVVFLANESKQSERDSFTDSPSNHGAEDTIRFRVEALIVPATKENYMIVNHAAEENVTEEQEESMVIVHHDSLQQLDQCDQVNASSSIFVAKESKGENDNVSMVKVNIVDQESEEVEEQGRAISQDEVIEEEVIEKDVGLPTDELNRRAEDFIARFNMERQLEARMLVFCS